MTDHVNDRLRNYIRDELMEPGGDTLLQDDDDLLTSAILDSMGIMSLVAFIEDELSIRVPPEDVTIETFQTVTKIAAYLDQREESKQEQV